MKYEEFREQQQHTIDADKIQVEFVNLRNAQTMIIVQLPTGRQKGLQKTYSTKIAATAILGCFDAWDLFKSLNSK